MLSSSCTELSVFVTTSIKTTREEKSKKPNSEHILWALRAKHLLQFFKSKLLVSQGQLWEPGGDLLQICGGAGRQQVPVSIT